MLRYTWKKIQSVNKKMITKETCIGKGSIYFDKSFESSFRCSNFELSGLRWERGGWRVGKVGKGWLEGGESGKGGKVVVGR